MSANTTSEDCQKKNEEEIKKQIENMNALLYEVCEETDSAKQFGKLNYFYHLLNNMDLLNFTVFGTDLNVSLLKMFMNDGKSGLQILTFNCIIYIIKCYNELFEIDFKNAGKILRIIIDFGKIFKENLVFKLINSSVLLEKTMSCICLTDILLFQGFDNVELLYIICFFDEYFKNYKLISVTDIVFLKEMLKEFQNLIDYKGLYILFFFVFLFLILKFHLLYVSFILRLKTYKHLTNNKYN